MFHYGFRPDAHLTEDDPRASDPASAKRLFAAWARFWDTSRRVLVQKSPSDMIKTRFFQKIFTKEHTRFVVVLRHPFAVAHFKYAFAEAQFLVKDCLELAVRHWVTLHTQLLEDMQHIDHDHVVFVQYEHLMGDGTTTAAAGEARMQALMDGIYNFLGIESVPVRFQQEDGGFVTVEPAAVAGEKPGVPSANAGERAGWQSGRRLLEYHGSHKHVAVTWSDPHAWIPDYHTRVEHTGTTCKQVRDEFESIVNRFGYSLKDLTRIKRPVMPSLTVLWDA
jgi:hypothetical protein